MRASGLRTFLFGPFQLDPKSGELRRDGELIKIQPQPAKVLLLLAEHAGEVLTREEIEERIWGKETIVDEGNLRFCIRQVRAALGDDPENPRFIQTLPKCGYRFIANAQKQETQRPITEKTMLAVLPFVNLSPDPEQEYFSDGMTEEMITHLGRLNPQQLGVIARASAMRYKHTEKGIDQIGRELKVDHILEGSVRRAGGRVRITAQLVKVSDQTQQWTESYDRESTDVFAIQSDVAQHVARSLALELLPEQKAALTQTTPFNSEVHEAYLKGRFFWNKFTEGSFSKGIGFFEEAVRKDPRYALAYTGLADSYNLLVLFGVLSPGEAYRKAEEASRKALEIDETLAEAHTSLGLVKTYYEWDWAGAGAEFQRARELNPNYVGTPLWYSMYLTVIGKFSEAHEEIRRALKLSPFSNIVNTAAGWIQLMTKHFDEAVEQFQTAVELDANFLLSRYFLGVTYMQKGMFQPALDEFPKAFEIPDRNPVVVAGMVCANASSGRKEKARKLLEELKSWAESTYISPYLLAHGCTGIGEKDEAFVWLEKAYEERSSWMAFLKCDPLLDPLRPDPRFKDLLRRMNFPS